MASKTINKSSKSSPMDKMQQRQEAKAPKVSLAQYIRNVKNETSKVVWPTRKETITTTIMVFIMVTILSIFFLIVDQSLSYGIRQILNFGA